MPAHLLVGLAAGTIGAGVVAAADQSGGDARYALYTALGGVGVAVVGVIRELVVRRRRTGYAPPPGDEDALDVGRRLTVIEQTVSDVRDRLRDDLTGLRADLRADRAETRAELAQLGERVARLETRPAPRRRT